MRGVFDYKIFVLNKAILSIEVQVFLKENAKVSPAQMALKKSPFKDVSAAELAEQLDAMQRLKAKLPTWLATPNIYYPPRQNAEQCSSELTALYKATIVNGEKVIDLTGGYGVDVWALYQHYKELDYCEMNDDLFPIVQHNYKQLSCKNIRCHCGDSIEFLKNSTAQYDLIFLDPARRDDHNRKMVSFSDCVPNVVKKQDFLFEKTNHILVKASPMMDISLALQELKQVKEVHVVAVKNECKELLFLMEKGFSGEAEIISINLNNEKSADFTFRKSEEKECCATLSPPKTYLYEPNAAILKAGAFNILTTKFAVKKLHVSTHLYTSDEYLSHFPGRIYRITHNLGYHKKEVLSHLVESKINIKTYNFPHSPTLVQKKLGLKEGGKHFLFGVKTMDENYRILIAEQMRNRTSK